VSETGTQLGLFATEEAFVLRRSGRARRLSLRVFPHGVVEVVAPLRAADTNIRRFVREHADWIARARRQFRAVQPVSGIEPPAAIELAAVGERWEIEYLPGARRLHCETEDAGGRIRLSGPHDPHWQRQRLRAWLVARARATLLPWLDQVSAETGLAYAGATIRRQRSRWGSCSARRTISLNCALLFLAPELVRQLLVHELAHTRHLNHSRAFWRLVASLEPEFEALESRLREAWRSVPAWVNYDPA
jgi:predicted metal-dependent hydrolase